jgi:hypothetical protein
MYISAQQILNWNNQYAADRVANHGALTQISADDPRGWAQGPDYVAPVHTFTGQGFATTGNATFGLTDPMTLWAQLQSDTNAVYPEASASSISAIQEMQSIGSTDRTGSSPASTSSTSTNSNQFTNKLNVLVEDLSSGEMKSASGSFAQLIQEMQSIDSTDRTGSSTASTSDTNTTTYRKNLEKLLLTWASLKVSDTQTSTISAFA